MLAKFIAVASLVTFAVAGGINNSCNVANQYCCNDVQNAQSAKASKVLGLLNLDVGSITGQVGFNCSPLSVIGVGGNSCNAQPVCCSNNNFNGLVALGCSPLILNL